VGTVLTSETLHELRAHLQRDLGPRALYLLDALDRADGLDSDLLVELATLARDEARSNGPGVMTPQEIAQGLARDARIVELATDVLTALALDKLPAEAVLNIGRDEGQVNAKSPRFRWPSKAERAASIGPAGMTLRIDASTAGDECHLCQAAIADEEAATCTSAGCPRRAALEVEPAANEKMSRAQVEALPSHDRVVLGRIFAALLGTPSLDTWVESGDSAEDVWSELEATRIALADRLATEGADWPDIIRIAAERNPQGTTWRNAMELAGLGMTRREGERLRGFETDVSKLLGMPRSGTAEMVEVLQRALDRPTVAAPRYSLPESHPLRLYQWAEWLGALIRREEPSECWSPDVERVGMLCAALARVEACDVDGLDGLVYRVGSARVPVLTFDELCLLRIACARVAVGSSGGPVSQGGHRVPRVRGETAEVGK
jgi:hypothetical protein